MSRVAVPHLVAYVRQLRAGNAHTPLPWRSVVGGPVSGPPAKGRRDGRFVADHREKKAGRMGGMGPTGPRQRHRAQEQGHDCPPLRTPSSRRQQALPQLVFAHGRDPPAVDDDLAGDRFGDRPAASCVVGRPAGARRVGNPEGQPPRARRL